MEFPGVKALDDVSFDVRAGSIHALMGENGAGKSTLLKILSGAYSPTGGALAINGGKRVFTNTADALAAGVAVIYQELHLVPEMSVAENLFLGHLPQRFGIVNRRALADAARKQLELIGENIDPWMKLGRLSLGQRQMVEIAKALTRGARIIAFDEPTSSLSDREVRRLFKIIRELRERDCAILYVAAIGGALAYKAQLGSPATCAACALPLVASHAWQALAGRGTWPDRASGTRIVAVAKES